MSVPAARAAIEEHLSEFFEEPQVAVSVGGYNSMVFYVVFESEGKSIVHPMRFFGHQSVMGAIAMLGGPPGPVIRARLTNPKLPRLDVDWPAILDGDFSTDYRLCPDDRIVMTLRSADGIRFSEGTDVTADAAFDQDQSPTTPERRPSTSPYLNLLKD